MSASPTNGGVTQGYASDAPAPLGSLRHHHPLLRGVGVVTQRTELELAK
jgi:hypothetical protein